MSFPLIRIQNNRNSFAVQSLIFSSSSPDIRTKLLLIYLIGRNINRTKDHLFFYWPIVLHQFSREGKLLPKHMRSSKVLTGTLHPFLENPRPAWPTVNVMEMFLTYSFRTNWTALFQMVTHPLISNCILKHSMSSTAKCSPHLAISTLRPSTSYRPSLSLLLHLVPKRWTEIQSPCDSFLISEISHFPPFSYLSIWMPACTLVLCSYCTAQTVMHPSKTMQEMYTRPLQGDSVNGTTTYIN